MDKLADKPPYIRFDLVPVEDREASINTGSYQAKDVEYVYVTPAGSKDELMHKADEWFERQQKAVASKRLDPKWYEYYQAVYDAWKKGLEPPPNGMPLTSWPGLSPAQHENLKRANIRSVEDVAAMNEEAIRMVGMGARALQQRALAYLDALRSGVPKVAEKVAALEVQNANLEATNASLRSEIAAIKQMLEAQAKAQVHVPAHQPVQLSQIAAEDILP